MSARKQNKSSVKTQAADSPLLRWIITIGLALFVLIFAYEQALFNGFEYSFESSIYGAVIYGYVLLGLTCFYVFRSKWQLNSHRSLLSIAVLLFPVVYWLSSLQAVSGYYAKFMMYIVFLLAGLFITGLYAAENVQTRKTIEYALMLASYIIVFIGLLNLFGQQYYRDALWLAHDGYRLTSVFQYSNTYAGFLTAVLLIAVYYTATCTRWYMRAANAIMLVPIMLSFLLTYSRGAIVVIPVMVLIIMPFLKLSRQIAYIAYLTVSALLTLVILGKITANADAIAAIVQPTAEKAAKMISLFSKLPLQSWLLLAGASIVTAGLIHFLHIKLYPWLEARTSKLSERKWSLAVVPGSIVIIGGLAIVLLLTSSGIRDLLPDKIAARFENINLQQHSVQERFTFYEDGLKVAADYPLLGAGGGGWQALYEQYQNNPYWSRQAHSYFVQTLVEVGWIGVVILLALLAYIYFLYMRAYIKFPERRGSHLIFFIFSVALLIHSALDFDMSYVYLSSLVFISLGCMLAPYGKLLSLNKLPSVKKVGHIIYPSAIGLLTIILLIMSSRQMSANSSFQQAIITASKGNAQLSQLLPSVNKAIKTSPGHSAFTLTKFQWLEQVYGQNQNQALWDDALETLEQAKQHDPYNREIILAQYRSLKQDNKTTELLEVLDEGVTKFQWDIKFYEKAIVEYVAAGQSDAADQEKYWSKAEQLRDEVQRRIDQLATLPPEQSQGRVFAFTPAMEEALSKINVS